MNDKKELKSKYKQMKIPMGVFQIKNISNGKILIDNSINMKSKWNRHLMELKFGKHKCLSLQQDFNSFGENNFVFEVLSELQSSDDESVDYQLELQTLQELIIQELNINYDSIYS